jgi:hypothetical protein
MVEGIEVAKRRLSQGRGSGHLNTTARTRVPFVLDRKRRGGEGNSKVVHGSQQHGGG